MKKAHIVTFICCILSILLSFVVHKINMSHADVDGVARIGIIYIGDASTPYTMNFIKAQNAVKEYYGDNVEFIVKENVPEDQASEFIDELVKEKCDVIIGTSYGYSFEMKEKAATYPGVDFINLTADNANTEPKLLNYHTAMGHIYEGRYLTGVIAGLKLRELIDEGTISADEAVIGYVAAYPYAEVISGYTSFYMGVHSIVPEATMLVKYTNSWGNYELEKEAAEELIDMNCVIISQHSDTTGPAVACENTVSKDITVFHVGYNQSMVDVAPTTSLTSSRINWEPYFMDVVEAILNDEEIEDACSGNINGTDAGAGMSEGWVEVFDLNQNCVTKNAKAVLFELSESIEKGEIEVFKGNFIGVNPNDASDTYDLNVPYHENANASSPSFHYILKDVITIVE